MRAAEGAVIGRNDNVLWRVVKEGQIERTKSVARKIGRVLNQGGPERPPRWEPGGSHLANITARIGKGEILARYGIGSESLAEFRRRYPNATLPPRLDALEKAKPAAETD